MYRVEHGGLDIYDDTRRSYLGLKFSKTLPSARVERKYDDTLDVAFSCMNN